jgi:hypothetical protein
MEIVLTCFRGGAGEDGVVKAKGVAGLAAGRTGNSRADVAAGWTTVLLA